LSANRHHGADERDGSFDLAKLQATVDAFVTNAATQSSLQRVQATFRSSVPQYTVAVDRVKAETLHVSVDQVFAALAGYLGSSYVDQFNKFGLRSRFSCRPIPRSGCASRTSPT
jgi:hydrophobic/amphiphilic exporter-1 (mainly G- bacteria), HAE1 family